jgi:histidine ammonia-lyase
MRSLGSHGVSFADVVAVARHGERVSLSAEALRAMERSAAVVADLAASDEPAYGISTGFGSLALVSIPPAARAVLQQSLIRSHAAGMGRRSSPRSSGR